jgi:hypothetical protein
MSGWGCPHEYEGRCQRVEGRPCDPGMPGCVLAGRFIFNDARKNTAGALRRKGGDRKQPVPRRKPS